MPRRDDGPLYHPTVAIVSLRAHTVFDFWSSVAAAGDPTVRAARSLVLEPRSLLVFNGDAYTDFLHGIQGRLAYEPTEGLVEGGEEARKRGVRISLTVRHVCNMV